MAGADRRRVGRNIYDRWALRWRPQRDHRCAACGRWIGLGAEAGHGWGFAWCEGCHLAAEHRRAAVWALRLAQGALATGAA